MKTDQEAIILSERAADQGKIRTILHEWGYEENEIQRVLEGVRLSRRLDESDKRSGQLTGAPLA